MARTRKTSKEALEEKIKKAEADVIAAKKKYDQATANLKELLDKRDAIRKEEILSAVVKSGRSYEEIMNFLNAGSSLAVLKEVLPVLEEQEDYTNDPLFETLSAFVKEHGYKNGYVMWPLRTAVSGKQMTPAGATEIMEIIGKDETIKRVKAAIEKLSK